MDIWVVVLFVFLTTLHAAAQPSQCPSGWKHRGNSCYAFFVDVPDGWTEAMLYCRALNAKLVEIETETENEFLRIYVMDHGYNSHFWIGLTDALVEGNWVWETTQAAPSYTDWSPGQPDDAGHHEDCVHLYSSHSFHWNDAFCSNKYSFICEKELHEDPDIIG